MMASRALWRRQPGVEAGSARRQAQRASSAVPRGAQGVIVFKIRLIFDCTPDKTFSLGITTDPFASSLHQGFY